jgi:hypothetical protein
MWLIKGASILKPLFETLAYLAALIYFLYKATTGTFVANLSLAIKCCRRPSKEAGTDYLSVVTTVKKGNNRLVRLFLGQVRAVGLESGDEQKATLDVRRVDYERSKVGEAKENGIKWGGTKKGYEMLNLPPGDESQFACILRVRQGEPYCVHVLFMARGRWKVATGQWRASDISLPLDEAAPPVGSKHA